MCESYIGIYLQVLLEKNSNLQPGEPLVEVQQGTLKFKYSISNHRNFSVNLLIVFIYLFLFHTPPGEPQEHRLGEVLQGRSKSKFNIIFSYMIVLVFFRGTHCMIRKQVISC